MSETLKEVATPHDVVRAARLLRDAASEPVRHPRVAEDWRALATRVEALADSLEALREAVNGCGVGSDANGFVCGSLPNRPTGPRMCRACSLNAWNAIATLTHGDE